MFFLIIRRKTERIIDMAETKKTEKKTVSKVASTAADSKKTDEKATKSKTTAASPAKTKVAAKKTTSTAKKTASKPAAKKASATKTTKKAPKKPAITIETICGKIEKIVSKTVKFKDKIAVDIEVWGFEDGSNAKMYIEANEGKVTVAPYTYDEKDIRVAISFSNAMSFAEGKIKLADLLSSSDFYAEGNIVAALKLASIF